MAYDPEVDESRPARALWIEITKYPFQPVCKASRPARALWIEITVPLLPYVIPYRRGPRGPCGLKLPWRPPLIGRRLVEAREGLVD